MPTVHVTQQNLTFSSEPDPNSSTGGQTTPRSLELQPPDSSGKWRFKGLEPHRISSGYFWVIWERD